MDYAHVALLFKHPAIRMLRADRGAFMLAFLHAAFKESGQTSVPAEVLIARLDLWLEEMRGRPEEFEWDRAASQYLDEWCAEDRAWLRKVHTGDLEPVFELTSATEKALEWLESLTKKAFVGTESRLENIFRELDDLLRYASDDVESRLSYLRGQRDTLDEEIAQILLSGKVTTYEPWQINERYAGLLEMARTLVGDFRQVEENFRQIAQEVVETQSVAESTKGEIVGRVLDSHDSVRESPQGRSFYGFVRLLLDPDRRERFEGQVDRVLELEGLTPDLREDSLLRRLLPRLRGEQEKVGASAQRLTSNLRRALETARLQERRRVRELISEIQTLALRVRESPPARGDFFEVEEMPEIWAGLSRPLWDIGTIVPLDAGLEADARELDWAMLSRLQDMPHLSLEDLRLNVKVCLTEREFISLSELLERFPVQQGIMELIGYFILAARPPHYFARDRFDEIICDGSGSWRIPRIMFCRELEAVT